MNLRNAYRLSLPASFRKNQHQKVGPGAIIPFHLQANGHGFIAHGPLIQKRVAGSSFRQHFGRSEHIKCPDPFFSPDLPPISGILFQAFLFIHHGISGLFFLGIRGPGSGPGGMPQDLILTAVLISILFTDDTSTPNLCKSFLQIQGIRFLRYAFALQFFSVLSEIP